MTNFFPGEELTAEELNSSFAGKLDSPLTPSLVPGVGGVTISGTPSAGQVPTATGPSAATWQSPQGSGIPITGTPGASGWIPVSTGSTTAVWSATIPSAAVTGVNGVTIGGTPQAGYVPTASGPTSATWGPVPGIPATGTPSIGWIPVATGPTTASWSATIPTSAVTGFDGVTVTGSAAVGQALIATSASAATWQNIPGFQPSGTPSNGWVIVATGASTSVWNPPAALTSANDTNVTLSLGGAASTALLNAASITIGWTGTLAAGRLNSNVVQAVVSDTNITAAIVAQTMTLAWAGTLAAGRLNANVVQGVTNDTNVTGTVSAQSLTLGWTGTLSVPRGGTGAGMLAASGVLYGNGTSPIQALAVNATATNKFLTQSSSASPAWATIASGDLPVGPIQVIAGTTSKAPINFATGVAPTSPVDGDMWFDNFSFYARINGVTYNLVLTPIAVVGPFNPTTLFVSNTGGWWDPSDLTTTFQDTAGTIPANIRGQPVARINDKSGNGNHLLQATPSKCPILQELNGNWRLSFDGVSQTIEAVFTQVQPLTRINTVQQVSWVNGDRLFDGGSVGNRCSLVQNPANSPPSISMTAGGSLLSPTDASDLIIGSDHVVSEFYNGVSSTLVIDNGSTNTGNPGASNSGGFTIASNSVGSQFGQMYFYGGVCIGRALTGPETASCRTFFGAKAGLVL